MAGIVGYRLGGAKIFPSSRKLIVGSTEQAIRPKAFAVLVYLIENHDRIVSKDELIRALWPGVAVSDDSVVQCIAEARRLLGDNSRQPQFIRTASKAGYQYIGPVEQFDPTQDVVAAAVIEETDSIEVEVEEEIDEMGGAAPRSLPAPRRRFGLGAKLWVAAIPGLVIVLILAYFWRRPPAGTLPRAEAGWWKFDGLAAVGIPDASGHGQTGTWNGAAQAEPGIREAALRLDANAYVSGHDSRWLPSGDSPRALSAWVKMDAPRVENAFVFSYGSNQPGHTPERFDFGVLTSGRVGVGSDIQGGWIMGKGRVDDRQWHMISATYGGGRDNRARIYIDGELDYAGTFNVSPVTQGRKDWRIGQSLIGSGPFHGAIGDVRIYDWSPGAAQIKALYRCSAGFNDLGDYYYLPVFDAGVGIGPHAPGQESAPLRNLTEQLAGIALARHDGGCALPDLQGADAGQDLRLSVELLAPGENGLITEAGPYFRARRSKPGETEGVMFGGESAGYWVALHSNGMLKVKCMNPPTVAAFTPADPKFDATIFHRLEVETGGETLRAWLDGRAVEFEQNGQKTLQIRIPAAWAGPPPRHGQNQGAAGIIFGNEYNRGQTGGQQARDLRIAPLDRQRGQQ